MVGTNREKNLEAFVVFPGELKLKGEKNYVTIGEGPFQVRVGFGGERRFVRGDVRAVLYIEDIVPPKKEGLWTMEPMVFGGGRFNSVLSYLGFRPVGFARVDNGYFFRSDEGEFFCPFQGRCRRKRFYRGSFDLYLLKRFRVDGMECMVLVPVEELEKASGTYALAVGSEGSCSLVEKNQDVFRSLSDPPVVPLKSIVLYGKDWF